MPLRNLWVMENWDPNSTTVPRNCSSCSQSQKNNNSTLLVTWARIHGVIPESSLSHTSQTNLIGSPLTLILSTSMITIRVQTKINLWMNAVSPKCSPKFYPCSQVILFTASRVILVRFEVRSSHHVSVQSLVWFPVSLRKQANAFPVAYSKALQFTCPLTWPL